MATPKVYVICDQNCKFEGMTKEQTLTAIVQAVKMGTIGDIDEGFVTTIRTINGKTLKFFVGEKSAYDALTEEEKSNLFAIITNDITPTALAAVIEQLRNEFDDLVQGLNDGTYMPQSVFDLQTQVANLSNDIEQTRSDLYGYIDNTKDQITAEYKIHTDMIVEDLRNGSITVGSAINAATANRANEANKATNAINATIASYAEQAENLMVTDQGLNITGAGFYVVTWQEYEDSNERKSCAICIDDLNKNAYSFDENAPFYYNSAHCMIVQKNDSALQEKKVYKLAILY